MSKCYVCDLTKEKVVKYHNHQICEECLELIYNTTPKILNVCLPEDCFIEFA
jgi:hypothetical protein